MEITLRPKPGEVYTPDELAYLEALSSLANLGELEFLIERYAEAAQMKEAFPSRMGIHLTEALMASIIVCEQRNDENKNDLRAIAQALKKQEVLPSKVIDRARRALKRLQKMPPKNDVGKPTTSLRKKPAAMISQKKPPARPQRKQ